MVTFISEKKNSIAKRRNSAEFKACVWSIQRAGYRDLESRSLIRIRERNQVSRQSFKPLVWATFLETFKKLGRTLHSVALGCITTAYLVLGSL